MYRWTVICAPVLGDELLRWRIHTHLTLCKVAKGAQHDLVTPCPGTNHLLYVVPSLLRHHEFPEVLPMIRNVSHDACADHAVIPAGIREGMKQTIAIPRHSFDPHTFFAEVTLNG